MNFFWKGRSDMAWIGNNNKLRDTYHNMVCKPICSCIQGTTIVFYNARQAQYIA